MNSKTKKWIHGLAAAFIGGGASAIVSGLTSMGFAPDKFNLTDLKGFGSLMGMMLANFLVTGLLSTAFYLRQSPLPPEPTGNTETIKNPNPPDSDAGD